MLGDPERELYVVESTETGDSGLGDPESQLYVVESTEAGIGDPCAMESPERVTEALGDSERVELYVTESPRADEDDAGIRTGSESDDADRPCENASQLCFGGYFKGRRGMGLGGHDLNSCSRISRHRHLRSK